MRNHCIAGNLKVEVKAGKPHRRYPRNVIVLEEEDVSKNLLKEIILEQEFEMREIFENERIVEREALNQAKKYLRFPNILAILGID